MFIVRAGTPEYAEVRKTLSMLYDADIVTLKSWVKWDGGVSAVFEGSIYRFWVFPNHIAIEEMA